MPATTSPIRFGTCVPAVHVYHAFPDARAYPRARARLCVWRLPLARLLIEPVTALYSTGGGGGNRGERRGAAQDADRAANQRPDEEAATEALRKDKQATPAMAIESCSECETSERESQPERHSIE